METVLVTGGTGFIGQAVVLALLKGGFRVRVLARREAALPPHPNLEIVLGDMTDGASLRNACEGASRIVHLAAQKSDERDSFAVNVEGARALRTAAESAGVKQIVNLSTQSAKLTKRGIYGETKKQADEILSASYIPVLTLRSSLVYGESSSGVFQTILTYAKLPVIPIIGNGQYRFRPIHRDDLAAAIAFALTQPPRSGIYDAGGPDLLSFDEIVRAILKEKGLRKPLLHLPISLAMLLTKLPKSPLTRSNVLGSAQDIPMDIEPFRRDFPVSLRSFAQGLHEALAETPKAHDPQEILEEALFLLKYVRSATGGWKPSREDAERYLRAVAAHGIPDAPTLTHAGKRWIGGLDTLTRLKYPHCTLRQKLLVACAIAECHPASARSLLPRRRNILAFFLSCAWIGVRGLPKLAAAAVLRLFPSFVKRHAS
jgi:uncharacterized protein YbjT (DUF2867 family)